MSSNLKRIRQHGISYDKNLEGEMAQVMANSYLWQKNDSPRCCKLSREAFDIFNELNS